MGDEDARFWARGGAPARLERRGKVGHDIRLSNLPHMEEYDEPDVFSLDVKGFSTGSNPVRQVALHINPDCFVEHEEVALQGLEEEVCMGW